MKRMKRKIELPLLEPLYSTYHYQGPATAVLVDNPSIRNWYMNQVMILTCTRRFLNGFTTPEISIVDSSWSANPYLAKKNYGMQFLGGYTHYVIRNLLDAGYYVCFNGVDDYYVDGKSWYHQRHFNHDGCICGYDQENKTYCIYAYDQNWIYRKFHTPQKSFDKGMKAQLNKGVFGFVWGIKPVQEQIAFSPETALERIKEYLLSDMEKYPEDTSGDVYGIVVHDYIAKYVEKLHSGAIPHERMDRRVFRLIWEQKKAMLERIQLIEQEFSLGDAISKEYESVVKDADHCRMLYASHHMKQRNSVLPIIQKKLLSLKEKEKMLLQKLLENTKGENQK